MNTNQLVGEEALVITNADIDFTTYQQFEEKRKNR